MANRVKLHVMRLADPEPSPDRPITVSVDGSCLDTALKGGCAAVSSSGSVLVGWYLSARKRGSSQIAELQAIRLGLRLAKQENADAVITDDRQLANFLVTPKDDLPSASRIEHHASTLDRDALNEIRSLLPEIGIAVKVEPRPSKRLSATDPRFRLAHTLAWAVRRMIADGIDPRQGEEWLRHWIPANGVPNQANLTKYYVKWLRRQGA